MSKPTSDSSSAVLALDFRAIYNLLREKIWLLLAITLAAGALGAAQIVRAPKLYEATTTVEVEEEERFLKPADGGVERRPEDVLKTIEQNIQSPALMLRLVERPELVGDAAFFPDIPRAAKARLQAALSSEISTRVRAGTRLIDITVLDRSPMLAQQIARLVVDEFVASTAERRASVSHGAREFLQAETARLKASLERSERALQDYNAQHQADSLEDKQNVVGERLKELNAKLTASKTECLKLAADRAQLDRSRGQSAARLLTLPSIASSPEVSELQRKLSDKESGIATLSQRYKSEHPMFIQAASAAEALRKDLALAALKAAESLDSTYEAAQETVRNLGEALAAQEKMALQLSETAIPYKARLREVESDRVIYDSLLARLKESDVAAAISRYSVHVAVPASLPERPSKPNKRAILLLSICAGIAVGLTLVFGSHVMDGSLKTVDEAERRLALRSVGAIPHRRKTKLGDVSKVLVNRPQSAVAEAFRSMRTELSITGQNRGGTSTIFASAVPGEGKSFCAINYAVALAQQGLRTLLIDADLRLPSVERTLLTSRQAAGFSDLLLGDAHVGKAIHLTEIENLAVMPAGKRVPDPTKLFGRSQLEFLFAQLREDYDRVVIDTAPIHAVSDTLLLLPHVEAVCLVVRAGKTPASAVIRALEKLRTNGANVVGFVLNALPANNGGYYYHYHAKGYGPDEVYGASAFAET